MVVEQRCILQKTLLKMQLIKRPYDISSSSKAAGLVETLQEKGLYRFCTYQCRFAKLPMGTVETLLKPENLKRYKRFLLTTLCQVNERC
jgi:uncharacterized surface protein with fasciclin (FAS1) repeats